MHQVNWGGHNHPTQPRKSWNANDKQHVTPWSKRCSLFWYIPFLNRNSYIWVTRCSQHSFAAYVNNPPPFPPPLVTCPILSSQNGMSPSVCQYFSRECFQCYGKTPPLMYFILEKYYSFPTLLWWNVNASRKTLSWLEKLILLTCTAMKSWMQKDREAGPWYPWQGSSLCLSAYKTHGKEAGAKCYLSCCHKQKGIHDW